MQEEYRAPDVRGVLHGIVAKAVEPSLVPSPENQLLGAGKRGHSHGLEPMSNSVQQPVENRFRDNRIWLHAACVHGV